ncbi:Mu homology domain-containing protein [Melampsora americana]|nr:Mu homology domain-containing protein [Melampsora americana]
MINGMIIKEQSTNQIILNLGYQTHQPFYSEDLNQSIHHSSHSQLQFNQKPILTQVLNHHQLDFIAITHQDIEPSILLGFLNQFIQILKSYINSNLITPYLIQSNFLIILQIFNLLINFNFLSSSTSIFNLLDYLLPNQNLSNPLFNLIQTSLNQSNQSIINSTSSTHSKLSSIFNSPLPWRPIDLNYNKDEIYLDLIETLFITVDDTSKILKSNLIGKINVDSKLSGMPEVLLSFKDFNLNQVGFHPSIKYGKWKKDSMISFIPPNHSFNLLTYKSNLNQSPLRFKTQIHSGRLGGHFQIELHSINQFNLSNLNLKWSLGKLCNGLVSDQVIIKSIHSIGNHRSIDLNSYWDWDPIENVFKVQIDLLKSNQSVLIQGLWNHSSIENKPSPEILIEFQILPNLNLNYSSLIGLKVDKLMVLNSNRSSNQTSNQTHLSKGIKTKLDQCRILLRW